jgi:hypothetical protein
MKLEIEWAINTCAKQGCHCLFAIPKKVDERLRDTKESHFCPFGHSLVYGGDTKVEKLRRIIEAKNREIERLTPPRKKRVSKKLK